MSMAAVRIGAVLMASGFGTRFGSNKLLCPVEGISMLERTFAALPAGLFTCAAVVSACPEILSLAEKQGYRPIPNPDAAQGQSASVRLGLSALGEVDGALFAVCDQPRLKRESAERLLRDFSAHPDCICALGWRGRRGNPAVFPAALFPALLSLTGDVGGGVVIRRSPERLRLVEAGGPEELRDVDTPADLDGFGRK